MLFKSCRPNMNITFSTDNYTNSFDFEIIEHMNTLTDKINAALLGLITTSRYTPEVQGYKYRSNKKSDFVNRQNQLAKKRHI